MKANYLLTAFLFFCFTDVKQTYPQYTPPDQKQWNVDPRQTTIFNTNSHIRNLPPSVTTDTRTSTAPSGVRIMHTPIGDLSVSPSFMLLPSSDNTTQTEVYMTRHPGNSLILYGSSNSYQWETGVFSEGTYVSTNGGSSWYGSDVLGPSNQGGDPGPFIHPGGVFVLTHAGLFTQGLFSNRSTDNGLTWSTNLTILSGAQDKNFATVDDSPISPFYGRGYVVWSKFSISRPPIAISYTTNAGISWSVHAAINTSALGHFSQGADVRCGPNGEVYVCWANPLSSTPFTEDFCGFAKSTDGGITWVLNNTNVFDMNGIRGFLSSVNNIRVNSFPRIDVDRTCGPRTGWIYIVASQIDLAPAGTDADIILRRSTNGGVDWSNAVRVNQDTLNNGKLQYFPCVRIDEAGGVNIFYYDNRNTTAPTMQTYLSRSIDGGDTFYDVKITDHDFVPSEVPATGDGYQGDYIGITSADGKVWCNWMDNSSGLYQSWAATVDYAVTNFCEEFECAEFPPSEILLEISDTNYWSRQDSSAYGAGSGSVRFEAWNTPSGSTQSISSLPLNPTEANDHLVFDEAYGPGTNPDADSLIVESSTDNGLSWTSVARLWGGTGSVAGPLNTIFEAGGQFVPAANQWRSKVYALPVGTNRIKLKGISGSGNDIWVDNICVKNLAPVTSNTLGIASEGMWIDTDPYWRLLDTVRIYLHRTDFPNIAVDSAITIMGNDAVTIPFNFPNAQDGIYYNVVKHRNCIQTWSASGLSYERGGFSHYSFLWPADQAFMNNQKMVNPNVPYFAMYSGDIINDSAIDLSDVIRVYNDANLFLAGYEPSDVTGDNFVDLTDIIITFNNAKDFVARLAPDITGSAPAPSLKYDIKNNDLINETGRKGLKKLLIK